MQQEQLQVLFDDLSAALVLYARQWCQSPDDAVQEAFVELFRIQEDPQCPRAWLYTATRRRAQNIARAEQRRRKHHETADRQRQTQESSENWFRTSEESLVAGEVAEALSQLQGEERELLVARIWGELSFDELSKLLQCSVSSAHRRYNAALMTLKTIMTQQPGTPVARTHHGTNQGADRSSANPISNPPSTSQPKRTMPFVKTIANGLAAEGDT